MKRQLSMPRYWDQVLSDTNDASGVTTPNTPVKVNPNTKYLLVIANPGYQLKDRLDAFGGCNLCYHQCNGYSS